MKRIVRLLFPLLCAFATAQVPVTPIIQPHMVFNNNSGLACAGCSLFSYAAGTTTPTPTYTDSTGTSQNTNPTILGADGGANIWLGAGSLKLVLKDVGGSTIFSVDNVSTAGLSACAAAGAIAFENSSANGLTCDPTITVNPASHAISVGTLPASHVSILALGTPTTWTFDTTTPATALASLGGAATNNGTTNQLAFYAAAGNTLSGTSVIPPGITGTTQSPNDTSTKLATTAYVTFPGGINPTSVQVGSGSSITGNQGTGSLVQHSTGSTTANDCVKYDANGNVVDSGSPCATGGTPRTCNINGCYRIDSDGTVTEWFNGPYSASAYNETNVPISLPFTMPTSVDGFSVSTSTTGGDAGEMALFTVSGFNNSSITVFNTRNSDHGGNSIAPFFIVIGH